MVRVRRMTIRKLGLGLGFEKGVINFGKRMLSVMKLRRTERKRSGNLWAGKSDSVTCFSRA